MNGKCVLTLVLLVTLSITQNVRGALNCAPENNNGSWKPRARCNASDYPKIPDGSPGSSETRIATTSTYYWYVEGEYGFYAHNFPAEGDAGVAGSKSDATTISMGTGYSLGSKLATKCGVVEGEISFSYNTSISKSITQQVTTTYGNALYSWRFRQFQQYEDMTVTREWKTTGVKLIYAPFRVALESHAGKQVNYTCP